MELVRDDTMQFLAYPLGSRWLITDIEAHRIINTNHTNLASRCGRTSMTAAADEKGYF